MCKTNYCCGVSLKVLKTWRGFAVQRDKVTPFAHTLLAIYHENITFSIYSFIMKCNKIFTRSLPTLCVLAYKTLMCVLCICNSL